MHPSALKNGERFFRTYLPTGEGKTIVEVGSQDVNGSLRQVAPEGARYIGLDFQEGKGVDILLDVEDPYSFPLADNSADAVVTSSVLEHSEFFWLLFNELMRVVKPGGVIYVNAPSFGAFHRYPVDCYRFYPDFGPAMAKWARRSGYGSALLLESYICIQREDEHSAWHDNVSVYLKDEQFLARYPARILDGKDDYINGFRLGHDGILKQSKWMAPEEKLRRFENKSV